jgi:hypothetical protein
MTDQPQNSLTIEQIIGISEKVNEWDTSSTTSLREYCYGRYVPESSSSYTSFIITLTPNKYPFIRKVKSVDILVEFNGSNHSRSVLGKYYGIDWPAAIKLYNTARETALKNNKNKVENSRQEGVKLAQSLLEKK